MQSILSLREQHAQAMAKQNGFLYLRRADVMAACEHLNSVAIMENVFRLHASQQTILPDEAYLGWKNAHGECVRSLNMPAYVGGSVQFAGTKIINGNIANPSRSLPRASGLTLLFDDISVRVVCMLESAYISSLRTASVSVLSAQVLQGQPIECVAVIGAGVIAQMHVELLARFLSSLRTIRIYDIDSSRIAQLQAATRAVLQEHAVTLEHVSSAEAAIRPAQLVIPATTTTTGYIRYDWLQPGTIVVNISLEDVLPEVVMQAECVIVDDWSLVKNDPHRLLGRMYREKCLIGPDDEVPLQAKHGYRRVDAQLGEVVLGQRGQRQSLQDIILVNPFGLAIEDIALAAQVYQIANATGLGQFLAY